MDSKKTLTPGDLSRIYFHAQDDQGNYISQNAFDATNEQFDAWAKSRMHITNDDGAPWSLPERAIFCNILWQDNALVMLKEDIELASRQ